MTDPTDYAFLSLSPCLPRFSRSEIHGACPRKGRSQTIFLHIGKKGVIKSRDISRHDSRQPAVTSCDIPLRRDFWHIGVKPWDLCSVLDTMTVLFWLGTGTIRLTYLEGKSSQISIVTYSPEDRTKSTNPSRPKP